MLYRWKKEHDEQQTGSAMSLDERVELILLRKEIKNLRKEKEILKNAATLFAKEIK